MSVTVKQHRSALIYVLFATASNSDPTMSTGTATFPVQARLADRFYIYIPINAMMKQCFGRKHKAVTISQPLLKHFFIKDNT